MTDYYPFIAREVSNLILHGDGGESRRKAYERARDDLVANLHQPSVRITQSEIACELRAFDAAVQKIEAELARAQPTDAALSPSVSFRSSSDSARSIIGSGAGFPKVAQTEESQISSISEGKSAPVTGAHSSSDLNWQNLHEIAAALDPAIPGNTTKTKTEQVLTEENVFDSNARKASESPVQTKRSDRNEAVEVGEKIFRMPRDAVVAPRDNTSFNRKSDLRSRTHFAVALVRAMHAQLNIAITITIGCALFVVIYFFVNIGK
jgi:hypothetical protein